MGGRVGLTRRGAWTAGAGVVLTASGLLTRYPGLTALGLALLALVLAATATVALPAPVAVRRDVSPLRLPRLARCRAELCVENGSGSLPLRLDAVEHVGDARLPVSVPVLPPRHRATVAVDVPVELRGRVRVGPLVLRRVAPAGLAVSRAPSGGVVEVTVLPRVLACAGLPTGVRRGHVGADEVVERGGTDLIGLREYVPGDDLRRLHWASSARTGTLVVREDADPSRPHLTVVVDLRPGSYDGQGEEEAADVAASLAAAAVSGGHPVRLVGLAGALDVEVAAGPDGRGHGPAALDPVLEELARPTGSQGPGDGAGGPVPLHDTDVVAVVSGRRADLAELLEPASRAALGVVLVVDGAADRLCDVLAETVVLRGPRAEDLLAAWDARVVR